MTHAVSLDAVDHWTFAQPESRLQPGIEIAGKTGYAQRPAAAMRRIRASLNSKHSFAELQLITSE
jgi:hypothetical protein